MEKAEDLRRSIPDHARFSHWVAGDGWSVRRLEWAVPEGAIDKGTLFFAGGRGDFIEKYLEVQRHWNAQGWHVIAIDWRGQGGSCGNIERGHLDDFGPLTRDLAGMLSEIPKRQRRVVIGHSMGGHLVLRTLLEHRPDVNAAVLVAPMIDVNSGPIPPWLGARLARVVSALGGARHPLWSGAFGPAPPGSPRQFVLTSCSERYLDELWWWERNPAFSLGPPSWGWLNAAYRSASAFFTPEKLRSLAVPVLVIGTDKDRLVRPSAMRNAAGLLPRAELFMYPSSGHEILREADGIRLDALARIDAFLAQHS